MVAELFTQAQIETFEIITEFPGISINEIAKKARVSRGTVVDRINRLEARGWLKSHITRHKTKQGKIWEKRQIYLPEDCPKEEFEPVLLIDIRSKLMRKFALDELDARLLEQVKGDEPPRELAERFRVLENQIKLRIQTSIPTKFEVATEFRIATFQGAKTLFLELMKAPAP